VISNPEAFTSTFPGAGVGVEECWMDMDGGRMRYLRAGSGPALILLHGLLGYSFSWRYTIPALAPYATVYAPDMLGSGFSHRPPGLDCSLRAVAQRLLCLVEKLGLSRFDLVGTSHGGAVAMMAAAQSLDSTAVGTPKMGKLVLVAPVNPYSAHGRWLAPFLGGRVGSALLRFTAPRATFLYGYALRRLYGDPNRIAPGTLEGYMAPLAIPGLFEHGLSIVRTWTSDLRELEALLPELPAWEAVAEVTPAVGEKRRRVGMLLGCVQREFFPQVNAATARVLATEGCEVVSPADQPCCGALLVHAGEEEAALALARHLINVFERAGVDAIVTNAAGCGSNVKEYGYLLRDDPQYAARAKEFSAKCKDVSEVLAELPKRAQRNPLQLKVAFHDSCHLQHAQGVRSQPRNLLAAIPELELLEIPEAAICCGSAGIYNLVQPNAANALGDRKAGLIASLDADVVVTGNPGCILQLQASLERAGKKIPVLHTIQLLDASIRGQLLSALRK